MFTQTTEFYIHSSTKEIFLIDTKSWYIAKSCNEFAKKVFFCISIKVRAACYITNCRAASYITNCRAASYITDCRPASYITNCTAASYITNCRNCN